MNSLATIALIIGSASLLASLYLLWEMRNLNNLRKTFFAGGKAVDLEQLLHSLARHINDLEITQDKTDKRIVSLEHNMNLTIQKIGIVRFNPFQDGGGNFSFCFALLNAHNSGLVLTSMHGREQNRIYSKRITNGKSEQQLTTEEIQAIETANQS